jgi:hypothetical protein|eukprot:Stramenopile-MAST_4_protein_3391
MENRFGFQEKPRRKSKLDELSEFVEIMNQAACPQALEFDSPQVVLKICPNSFSQRLNQRKMVQTEHKEIAANSLKAKIQKHALELRRKSEENEELKEKIKSLVVQHKEESNILMQKKKAETSIPVMEKHIEDFMSNSNKENKLNRIITEKRPKSKGFLGLACCSER